MQRAVPNVAIISPTRHAERRRGCAPRGRFAVSERLMRKTLASAVRPDGRRSLSVSCKEFIALLADYLEMIVRPEVLAQLEEHLANCPPCQAYLRTYRRTREIAATSERDSLPPVMPDEMKVRLRAFLLAQLLEEE
jgi:hypothetical protein